MEKKSKFCNYYSGLIKKYGFAVPVLSALAVFAILFYVRFVGMFDSLNEHSPLGYWFVISCSLISVILIDIFIAFKLKCEDYGAADALLFTLDFLMAFLLVGIIVYDFVSLTTVYYAAALIAVIVLNVLRIRYADPAQNEVVAKKNGGNIKVGKYFGLVIGRFNFWKLFMAAFLAFSGLALSNIWGFPALFLTNGAYTAGLLLAAVLAAIALLISLVKRVDSCEIGFIDAFMMFAFFTVILSVFLVIFDFTILKFMLWLFAFIASIVFINIMALNTYFLDAPADSTYFITEKCKTFNRGPKVYFKHFYHSFDLFALAAISLLAFAVLSALIATGFFVWANGNGFLVYAILGVLLFGLWGIIYMARRLKNKDIGYNDALLAIMDVALLLLTVIVFTAKGQDSTVYIILWALFFALCIAFSITRMFMVKEPAPEKEAVASESETETVQE